MESTRLHYTAMHFEHPAADWADAQKITDSYLEWMKVNMRVKSIKMPDVGSLRKHAGAERNQYFHYLLAELKMFYKPPADLKIMSMMRYEGKGWAIWVVTLDPASSEEIPFMTWKVLVKIDDEAQAVMCKLANCHAHSV